MNEIIMTADQVEAFIKFQFLDGKHPHTSTQYVAVDKNRDVFVFDTMPVNKIHTWDDSPSTAIYLCKLPHKFPEWNKKVYTI